MVVKYGGWLWPSPRQQFFVIGFTYFVLGYILQSCWRMGVGASLCLLAIGLWRPLLRFLRWLPERLMRGLVALGFGLGVFFFAPAVFAQQSGQGQGGYVFLGKLCGLMAAAASPAGLQVGNAVQIQAVIQAVVNIVRALFVVYIVISLIGIFNSVRNDEDWVTAARTPMLAVVIVGIVEALSNLIGGNVGTC